MDDPTAEKPADLSQEPTVASILGIKGQLRFHPHGSTQKAHVVLRQVELSDESDDEGDSSTIYFSLFAQKRIEVKPGKEILLAVAAPDGKILDTPVVLAGRLSGPDDVEAELPVKRLKGDTAISPPSIVLPPKLRKLWNGGSRVENVATHPAPSPQRVFTSVGVQAEPIIIPHEPVAPSPKSPVSQPTPLQKTPQKHSRSIGTGTAGDTLTQAPTTTADKSTILPLPSSSSTAQKADGSPNRERSLSPMELDSPPSSPSPTSSAPPPPATAVAERPKSTSFSPPGLYMSTESEAKEKPAEGVDPVAPYNWSPDGGDPPGLSLLPPDREPIPAPVAGDEKPPSETSGVKASTIPDISTIPQTSEAQDKLQESTASSTTNKSPSSKPTPAPYVPRRKIVPNPFVSGGVITDFVGETNASKPSTPVPPTPTPAKATEPPQPPATPAPLAPTTPATSTIDTPALSTGASASSSPSPPTRVRSPRMAPSSPASSSKMKIEDFAVQPDFSKPPQPPAPLNGFHPIPIGPPHALPPFAPNLPVQRRFSAGGAAPPAPSVPILEPKSLSPVPQPTFSNPLGIRPSNVNNWTRIKPGTPAVPPSVTGKPNVNKKPVHIGNGWPRNRQQGNGNGGRQSFRRGSLPKQEQVVRSALYNNSPVPTNQDEYSPTNADILPHVPQQNGFGGSYIATRQPESWPPPEVSIPLDSGLSRVETTQMDASVILSPTGATTPTSASKLSANHPLPARPPAYKGPVDGGWSPTRGVKRMGSPVQHGSETRRRTFKWPVSDGLHTVKLRGDDDVGVRSICYNHDGSLFAVVCFDKSVRIWNNKSKSEVAKLAHNMQIMAAAWMDRDAGVVTLGDNGIVSTWTRSAANKWQWAKILDASGGRGEEAPCCLAFGKDRMAIAYPRTGVKVWLFMQGTWRPQRTIVRQNVTAIKFVEEGNALIGGTTDGVLWYCEVPNGTLRAYAFMKNKVYALDVDAKGTHTLAAQIGGRTHLVNIAHDDKKGKVEQVYSVKDIELQDNVAYDFGALFANRGKTLLFGVTRGCIMVWDRASGEIIHGLHHGEDHVIEAVACHDGAVANDGHILTGTRDGQLTWFAQPPLEGGASRNGTW